MGWANVGYIAPVKSEGEDGKRIGLLPGEIVRRRPATFREGQPVFKETPSQDLGRFGGRDRNSRGRPVSRVSSLRSNRGRSGGSASLRCHDQRSDRRTYRTSASIPGYGCGTLTQIGFKDGDVVHNGDLLFTIDPRQYEIRLAQANAQLETATAHLALADQQLARAEQLVRTSAGTVQNVDQHTADQHAAQAAVDDAKAQIRDAQFDLDHCRITAPFTGRIGTHLVSVGNLISGSRAGSSPTTLLATIVSLDPIYLNFDMSEADYMAFMRERQKQGGPLADKVEVSLSDETDFAREGTLDFIDNALDRSSGTIHARATIPNGDHFLTPGGFARVRVALAPPSPALLV